MMRNKSNLIRLVFLCILGLVLVWIWLRFFDLNSFKENLRQANFGLFFVALALFFFSMFVKCFRWNVIINQIQTVKFMTTFWILVTGNLINYIIPLRIGEVVKIALLKKKADVPVELSFATIFVDKMSDLSMVVWVLVLIPVLGLKLSRQIWIGLIIVACIFLVGLIFATLLLVFDDRIATNVARYRGRNKLILFLIRTIAKLTETITAVRLKPSKIFVLILITILIVIIDASKVYILYAVFGHQISPLVASFGALARYLLFAIPMPPAQIGSVELIWLMIYSGLFAIKTPLVNSVSVLAHSISIFTNLVLGTLGILMTGLDMSKIPRYDRDQDA